MSISKRGRPRLRHALFMATMAPRKLAYSQDLKTARSIGLR
ncbi:hypothetical protein [Paenibacillus sp. R14(2021)]